MSKSHPYNLQNIRVIHNKRLKNSYISLDKNAILTIKTPIASNTHIERILDEKSSWIAKQLKNLEAQKPLQKESLHSLESIASRLHEYAFLMGLVFSELKFKRMRSRWGSCSSSGVITLNSHLMYVEMELVEYVLVHELAHLVHMNHSKEFHSLVESHLSGAKELRIELKKIRLS